MAGGNDFLKHVTREEFEQAADALFKRCIVPVKKAMLDADIPLDEINDIVMVGGSSRIPKLKDILKEYFGDAVKINNDLNPDEVVALGATILAGVLSGQRQANIILNDVTPLSIGMQVSHKVEQNFFSKLFKGT